MVASDRRMFLDPALDATVQRDGFAVVDFIGPDEVDDLQHRRIIPECQRHPIPAWSGAMLDAELQLSADAPQEGTRIAPGVEFG